MKDYHIYSKRLSVEEYIEFLTRSDLGSQYPKERFQERIRKLLKNTQICLVAENQKRQIVGICFGVTDFAYWLLITDLGVDRDYAQRGIGSKLINRSRELAGGKEDVALFVNSNRKAVNFYKKNGFKHNKDLMELSEIEWTNFQVSSIDIPQ